MAKYTMTCTCGDTVEVEAGSKDEAVKKFADMMGPDATAKHFADKHAGQPVPSQDQVKAGVEKGVHEVQAQM